MAVPVVFYLADEDDRQAAHTLLNAADAQGITEYDEAIEAEVDDTDSARMLLDCGLSVEFPMGLPNDVPDLLSADSSLGYLFPATQLSEPERELLKQFKNQSAEIDIDGSNADELFALNRVPDNVKVVRRTRATKSASLDGFDVEGLIDEATKYLPPSERLLESDYYLVRLSGAMRPEWRKQLNELQVEMTGFQPPDTYEMRLSREHVPRVDALDFVLGIKRYGLVETVTREMRQFLEQRELESAAVPKIATFDVTVHRPEDRELVVSFIESATGKPVKESIGSSIRFDVDSDSPILAGLANLPQVRTISRYEPPGLMVNIAREIVGVVTLNPAGNPPHWTGSGETVAIVDSGVDTTHPAFERSPTAEGRPMT